MAGHVVKKDHGWQAILDAVKAIKNGEAYAKVGVVGSGAKATRDSGITNAQLAAIHEYGAPAAGIPQRSFIFSTVTENKSKYFGIAQKIVKGLYAGKMSLDKGLGILGAIAAADMKNKITAGEPIPPPNTPAVAARKAANGGNVRTLVDTGRLVDSITWDVVVGGKKH